MQNNNYGNHSALQCFSPGVPSKLDRQLSARCSLAVDEVSAIETANKLPMKICIIPVVETEQKSIIPFETSISDLH